MSTKSKATTTEDAYFITITTVGWVDVFTRLNQKYIITDSLKHCQQNKGLEIYAYCIMSSHVHLFSPTARISHHNDSAELHSVPTK
jgi:REP element-mobilizing transposase RayT